MFFQIPPPLPPAEVLSTDLIQAEIAPIELVSECKKGSRDCFPEDRVGAIPTLITVGWATELDVAPTS